MLFLGRTNGKKSSNKYQMLLNFRDRYFIAVVVVVVVFSLLVILNEDGLDSDNVKGRG